MAQKMFEQGGGAGDDLGKNLNANFTEVYGLANAAGASANSALSAGIPYMVTGTLTAAAAAAGVVIVPKASVGASQKVYVTGFRLNVSGSTAWTDATATAVLLKDTHATLPATGITFAKAALTGNRVIDSLDTTNVTAAVPLTTNNGFTAGEGVSLMGDANFGAGSDIKFTAWGYIR